MLSNDCPNCGEAVVVFSRSCAHCGAYNVSRRAAVAVTASLAVLVVAIGVAIFAVVGWHRVPGGTNENEHTSEDFTWLQTAMKECDEVAAKAPDSLYFLVLPMRPADPADRSWNALALQTVGSSYQLLSAKDALDGLRNKRLTLRPDRYTFSALDTESGQTYSWTSATGMSRLSRRESGATKTLKLGFDFSEAQAGAQWSAEFKRERGICYWLSALIRD